MDLIIKKKKDELGLDRSFSEFNLPNAIKLADDINETFNLSQNMGETSLRSSYKETYNGLLEFKIRHYKLDILAKYAGFESWNDFKAHYAHKLGIELSLKSLPDARFRPYLDKLILQSRIGFTEAETFNYEEAYGKWFRIMEYADYRICEEDRIELREYTPEILELIHTEEDLLPISELIQTHFQQSDERGNRDSFTFVVADFGKGKTTMMRQLAARYAKALLTSGKDTNLAFPIYINLRDASSHFSRGSGVIEAYLMSKYQLSVSKLQHFKTIIFFLDAFDEVGTQLTTRELVDEILPVREKKAHNDTRFRFVVATRPIKSLDIALEDVELNHYQNNEEHYGDTPVFIHAFGFTEQQVNHYFQQSRVKGAANIFKKLLDKGVMKLSELRRPLLSYILLKVLDKQSDINQLSRLGIYLSFLNYLTIEAKYIGDDSARVKKNGSDKIITHHFYQQSIFRAILHGMAVLWIMNRSGVKSKKKPSEPIELNKENLFSWLYQSADNHELVSPKTRLVEYMSHAYFGDDAEEAEQNNFYFKHQSFAEILIAEYYIKVLLLFAIEDKPVHKLDKYLVIGKPTAVAISFLRDILQVLRKSVGDFNDPEVRNARILLSPLLTSMTVDDKDSCYSAHLAKNWTDKENLKHFKLIRKEPADDILKKWPIDQKDLNDIIFLCEKRFNQERLAAYSLSGDIDQTITSFKHFRDGLQNSMEQNNLWVLLLAGNLLFNNEGKKDFFTARLRPTVVLSLIKMARYGEEDLLELWGQDLFVGLDLRKEAQYGHDLINLDLSGIDFSHVYFKGFNGRMVNFSGCKFHHVTLDTFEVEGCDFSDATFKDISIVVPENSQNMMGFSGITIHKSNYISSNLVFPRILANYLRVDTEDSLQIEDQLPLFINSNQEKLVYDNLEGLWQWVKKNRKVNDDQLNSQIITVSGSDTLKIDDLLPKPIAFNKQATKDLHESIWMNLEARRVVTTLFAKTFAGNYNVIFTDEQSPDNPREYGISGWQINESGIKHYYLSVQEGGLIESEWEIIGKTDSDFILLEKNSEWGYLARIKGRAAKNAQQFTFHYSGLTEEHKNSVAGIGFAMKVFQPHNQIIPIRGQADLSVESLKQGPDLHKLAALFTNLKDEKSVEDIYHSILSEANTIDPNVLEGIKRCANKLSQYPTPIIL